MDKIDNGQNPLVEKIKQLLLRYESVESQTVKQALGELIILSSQYFNEENFDSAYKKEELKEQIIFLLEILSNQELKIRYKDSSLSPGRFPQVRDALNERFSQKGLLIRIRSSNQGTRLVEIRKGENIAFSQKHY